MGAPHLTDSEDLPPLLTIADDIGVQIVPYWGEAVAGRPVADVLARSGAAASRLAGLAGDLCADGSIGSRTAAFRSPYADAPTSGRSYLTPAEVAEHVLACGRAGVQAGFHVIGDAAADTILDGLDRIVTDLGEEGRVAVTAARVRLEHLETTDDDQIARLARHGVLASMQPAFQATWGGPRGMYEQRLGRQRATRLNRCASVAAAGIPLALGSDSPVTPFDPWGAVRAAAAQADPAERLTAEQALYAHTRGAHLVADPGSRDGILGAGHPAGFAIWDTPGVPGPGDPAPRCLLTAVAGRAVHGEGDLV
jgi:hypothetical protein